MACLAGGGRRLVLLPRAAVAAPSLRGRGYATAADGGGSRWFTKTFSS